MYQGNIVTCCHRGNVIYNCAWRIFSVGVIEIEIFTGRKGDIFSERNVVTLSMRKEYDRENCYERNIFKHFG